jgi:ribosomal-protein-alanine N-acetyltransferase
MSNATLTIARADLQRDLAGIQAVDDATFTNPWTREMYEAEARRTELSHLFVVHALDAARAGDGVKVVAYCAVWLVADELHINNLAVHPDWRRRGIARELVRHALSEAARQGAPNATLEVRRSNVPARKLYEGLGFSVSGVRVDYYSHPIEDALILWRRAQPAEPVHRSSSADPVP